MRAFWRSLAGVTLLELLMVIAVIMIVSAITIPYWSSYKRHAQLADQAQSIVADLRTAQQNTVTSQITHTIKLNVAGNSYKLIRRDPNGQPGGYTETVVKSVNLVQNITFNSSLTTITEVIFDNTGAVVASGNIVVKDTGNNSKRIEIQNSGVLHIY